MATAVLTVYCHLDPRCSIVIDKKWGKFNVEYAGNLNFHLNAVDDRMKHESDQRSISLFVLYHPFLWLSGGAPDRLGF